MNSEMSISVGLGGDGKQLLITDKELEAQRQSLQDFDNKMGEFYYDTEEDS